MFLKIAYSGPAGSGKDFLANEVAQRVPMMRLSFADPLKRAVSMITGISVEVMDELKNGRIAPNRYLLPDAIALLPDEEIQAKARALPQKVGTEIGRDTWYQNVWVDRLMTNAKYVESGKAKQGYKDPADGEPWEGVYVTDCRFPNEFDALQKAGFLMVDIQCPLEFMRLKPGTPQGNHPSERALDDYRAKGRFDLRIYNDRATDVGQIVETILHHATDRYHERMEARQA